MNKKNKLIKFLFTLKRFWYVVLASAICFSIFGYFLGEKKSVNDIPFSKETKHYILKTNIIISDGSYQDFSETFNNSCLYFMKSSSVIKDSVNAVNKDMTESDALQIINVNSINTVSNMVAIEIKYTSKEDARLILDKYIQKATPYLNKTLKNNLNEDGTFKDGIEATKKILLTQIGDIEYTEKQETIAKRVTNVMKYVVVGLMFGIVAGVAGVYFLKFYFFVHTPIDVVKNFGIDYIGLIEDEKSLVEYIEKNKNLLFCSSGKNKITKSENYFTKEEIFNSDNLELGEEKNLVVLVKEDSDTFFYIEKIQLLLKNKIRGFILYK